MKRSSAKSVFNYIGYVITLLSFIYIYFVLKDARLELSQVTPLSFVYIAIVCLANSVVPFISAFTWKLTLEFITRRRIVFKEACSIYVKGSIAKYLPGNVMQYVGRNFIGVKYGWTNAQLALGSVLEVICLVTVPFALLAMFFLSTLWVLPDSFSAGLTSSLNIENIALVISIGSLICLFCFFILKKKIWVPL